MSINIERVRELADKLAITCNRDAVVDMGSIEIPSCGTPGCHAGELWLAMPDEFGVDRLLHGDPYVFHISVGLISEWLGFQDERELRQWAHDNPEIWGNKNGWNMFGLGAAFGQDEEMFPPHVIANHWAGVAERLESA